MHVLSLERIEVLERIASALAARVVAHRLFTRDLPQVSGCLPLREADAFLFRKRRIGLSRRRLSVGRERSARPLKPFL